MLSGLFFLLRLQSHQGVLSYLRAATHQVASGYHTGQPGAGESLKIFPCLTFYGIGYILSYLLFYFY